MKKYLVLLLGLMMALSAFMLSACGGAQESEPVDEGEAVEEEEAVVEEPAFDGNKIGYMGNDPAEYAAYKYMVEEIGKNYEEAEYTLAYAQIVDKDDSNPEDVLIKGSFYVEHFNLEGDTLKFAAGGNYPGCFHLKKNDDGSFSVTKFDMVEDGGNFDPSAKEIFGDSYEAFTKAYSDDEARDAARFESITAFVNANEVPATKYQDEGWDPIDLHL